MLSEIALGVSLVNLGGLAWLHWRMRDVQRALPPPVDPNKYRMMINGISRLMTLEEAVQHWRFERSKHAPGTAIWSAYNRRLHEVGVDD